MKKEHLLALLKIPDENDVRLIKEVDPGIWLIYLGQQETFALYNIATDGHVRCKISGPPRGQDVIGSFKLHPDYYMGDDDSMIFVDCGKVKTAAARIIHRSDDRSNNNQNAR